VLPAKWHSDCAASTTEFTPHVDTGDFIVVVNAGKLRVTGTKATEKKYFRHSVTRAASTKPTS
jgi:ribosomal protein L13